MDVWALLSANHAAVDALVPLWSSATKAGEHALITHGDWPRWKDGLERLSPLGTPSEQEEALMALHPWRKGPLDLFGVHIDTEWRSDWKWERLIPHVLLSSARVLDVGCGNGYYMTRIMESGAQSVIGVDPTVAYFAQYLALRASCLASIPNRHAMIPARFEALLAPPDPFDLVFSMGVLYHRADPLEHLRDLWCCLSSGGQLVLETLIVPQEEGPLFVPPDRYARMRNVHGIPTPSLLLDWVDAAGFSEATVVNITPTTPQEQRPTRWMRFESLEHALDPSDPKRTVEGYPAPIRALVVAKRAPMCPL